MEVRFESHKLVLTAVQVVSNAGKPWELAEWEVKIQNKETGNVLEVTLSPEEATALIGIAVKGLPEIVEQELYKILEHFYEEWLPEFWP